ncbi:MAG TPA: cytosine permease [Ktedonobacteraceae bacterium]|jgi:NCS1 family nucleobase:cation symporter-1|nr:cytosine permease [Ktedonobacteraceae bacterium]
MATENRTFVVEHHSIDYIPETERHGRPFSLFTLWFSANMQVTTVVTGAIAVSLGLPLVWALVAIVVGNVLGGIVMALHSAQGPVMGVPQMIQSRAQFGFYGALLPLVLVILMYLGFFASSAVLGGQALAAWTGLSVTVSIIIVSIICTILAVFGYDMIHRYEGVVSVLFLVGFIYLTARVLSSSGAGKAFAAGGSFSFGTFLLVVSIMATWQITYGPYVADYSRYLPSRTSISVPFWWTYAGSVISSIWMMALGSIAVAVAGSSFENDSVRYIVQQAGSGAVGGIFYLLVILGIIAANVLNLYGIFLTTTTTVSALQRFRTSLGTRLAFVLIAAVIGTVVAVLGQGNFITNYTNFLLLLLYFVIPWSAINLVDFYLLRHEQYDIPAIFDPDGIYGRVNWRAILAYIVAILLELPFVSTTLYTGPLVNYLGGADISWIIGLAVAAIVYYVLMKPQIVTQRETTVR